jgi:hypothetical protein
VLPSETDQYAAIDHQGLAGHVSGGRGGEVHRFEGGALDLPRGFRQHIGAPAGQE